MNFLVFHDTVSEQRFGMKRNTMAYTLGEATKATGLSKTSLHRAIKLGRISAIKTENGSYKIDPAELHRVFPIAANRNSSNDHDLGQGRTGEISTETGVLRRELELLREERDRERGQLSEQIDDLKRRLDQAEQERREKDRQLTALLTDQRAEAEEKPRRSWWRFGKG
jgi:hypothetical protein